MSEAEEGESLSNDPDEAKWDYFREESLLHVFHSLLHKVWDGGITSGQLATRIHELFFYAHQQFIRRYISTTCYKLFVCVLHAFTFFRAAVERNILGLRDIVPLTPYEMGKSLGPGYKAGVTKSSQSNVELC